MTAITASGFYQGDLSLYNNYTDPALYCGYASGPEGLVKVELMGGQTLDVTATITGGNPILYLLYNCAVGASCTEFTDASTTSTESLSYTNATAGNEILYLAVDSEVLSGPYSLDLQIH